MSFSAALNIVIMPQKIPMFSLFAHSHLPDVASPYRLIPRSHLETAQRTIALLKDQVHFAVSPHEPRLLLCLLVLNALAHNYKELRE
jgi:hypothetical protein